MDALELRPRAGTAEFTPVPDPIPSVVAVLRQAAVALDAMWRESLLASGGETAVRLGEASHGVHRALIALTGPGLARPSLQHVARGPRADAAS